MLDGYKDEDSFKKQWDPILAYAIEHKAWVKQFWDSADNTKAAKKFREHMLGTSRVDPFREAAGPAGVRDAMQLHELDGLLVCGGDGTLAATARHAYASRICARTARPRTP